MQSEFLQNIGKIESESRDNDAGHGGVRGRSGAVYLPIGPSRSAFQHAQSLSAAAVLRHCRSGRQPPDERATSQRGSAPFVLSGSCCLAVTPCQTELFPCPGEPCLTLLHTVAYTPYCSTHTCTRLHVACCCIQLACCDALTHMSASSRVSKTRHCGQQNRPLCAIHSIAQSPLQVAKVVAVRLTSLQYRCVA